MADNHSTVDWKLLGRSENGISYLAEVQRFSSYLDFLEFCTLIHSLRWSGHKQRKFPCMFFVLNIILEQQCYQKYISIIAYFLVHFNGVIFFMEVWVANWFKSWTFNRDSKMV